MSKKSFRPARAPEEPSASYPTWVEASSRRSFLATMGQAAAGGILASLALACGDERAVSDPDGGPPQNTFSDGVAPQPDVGPETSGGVADQAPAPPDMWPQYSDGLPAQPDVGLHDTGGQPDQPPAPPDMWPQYSDGLPAQPDVTWPPPANDAGGPPMPPAPKDGGKKE